MPDQYFFIRVFSRVNGPNNFIPRHVLMSPFVSRDNHCIPICCDVCLYDVYPE